MSRPRDGVATPDTHARGNRRGYARLTQKICWHIVKRTTVKIPDNLDAKLRHEAMRRGCTISELTREALEAHLGPPDRPFLAAAAGSFNSGEGDLARRIEEILAAEAEEFR